MVKKTYSLSIMKSKFTKIVMISFDQLIEDVTRTSYSTWLNHVNVNIPPFLWVKHLALSENIWPSTLAQAAAVEAVPWTFLEKLKNSIPKWGAEARLTNKYGG